MRFRSLFNGTPDMPAPDSDDTFHGPVPEVYERFLVPLIFQPYADDLAMRVAAFAPHRVLEIAAGTGVLTRAMAVRLPTQSDIVATDLSPTMLQMAQARGTARRVAWRQADAMRLPFADGEFDVVVCQFGAMFFPDRACAFAEARRVLAPGGVFLFNTWDRIEDNDFPLTVTQALADVFPDDPPTFMARIPHGYHDVAVIGGDLASGGFDDAPRIETLDKRSPADTPRVPAIAFCQGTPLRNEIQTRAGANLAEATDAVAEVLAARFGCGPIDGRIQAHVVAVSDRRDR